MYSFQPLANESYLIGFIIVGCLGVFITLVTIAITYQRDTSRGGFLVGNLIIIFAVYVVYTICVDYADNPKKVYANKKVNAELVGFSSEVEVKRTTTGKITNTNTVHYAYVIYNVANEGKVMLKAQAGATYPEKAVLYKN